MPDALDEDRRARADENSWLLARLVWPASRLDELEGEDRALSVLLDAPYSGDPRAAGDRDALGVRPRRPDRRGVRRTAAGRRVGGEGGRAGRARPAREGALRRRRGSVARGARTLPPSLPRRGCSFQGDGRPAPSAGNRRAARLPECPRRVRVRGRGRARGPYLADAGGSPLGRPRSRCRRSSRASAESNSSRSAAVRSSSPSTS